MIPGASRQVTAVADRRPDGAGDPAADSAAERRRAAGTSDGRNGQVPGPTPARSHRDGVVHEAEQDRRVRAFEYPIHRLTPPPLALPGRGEQCFDKRRCSARSRSTNWRWPARSCSDRS
ncbi:hypothetical protein HBB16_05335 [Pseudonocardia sp. MCCB 268]|nr:hypothetical protein [Pseudonocardia cytotoxica]